MNYLSLKCRKEGVHHWFIWTNLHLLAPHNGSNPAKLIRNIFRNNFQQSRARSLADFETSFTFVTNFPSTMLAVFGVSLPANKVPYSNRRFPCIFHQLNVAMKSIVESTVIRESIILGDLKSLKTIFSTFNHTEMNDELDSPFKIIQEISTRFGTAFDVIQHFLKSK